MLFISSFDMPRKYADAVAVEMEMLRVYHTKLNAYIRQYASTDCDTATSTADVYDFTQLQKHYELSLLDYVRFMTGWGMWGNAQYAEQRVNELLDRIDGGKLLSPAAYETVIRGMYTC